MSYKKRKTGRRSREAGIVGDLFRILFAVSMLVAAILLAFFVLKNLNGFSFPELKRTSAESSQSGGPLTIRGEESSGTEPGTERNTDKAETAAETAESTAESSEEAAGESAAEEESSHSILEAESDPGAAMPEYEYEETDYMETDYMETEQPTEEPDGYGIGIAPSAEDAGADSIGPGASVTRPEISAEPPGEGA